MPSRRLPVLAALLAALTASAACADISHVPCGGLPTAESFLGCDALCGSSPLAVRCDRGGGEYALSTIAELERWAWQRSERDGGDRNPFGVINQGCWRWSDLVSPDAAELLNLPAGVPGTDPPVAVRASGLPDGGIHLSMYIHVTEFHEDCSVDIGIAASWRPVDMEREEIDTTPNLETSHLILRTRGDCDGIARAGDAWKMTGWLLHPAPLVLPDFQDIACGVDGQCIEGCRVDFDCPCHHDGRCDPVGCVGDAECECMADGHCMAGCEDDPDCACIEDGECNHLCLELDPDCPCEADDCCSWECLARDPDCGCGEDGLCNRAPCGWFDPDCICGDDGLCNETCGEGKDPDCTGGGR